MFKKSAYLFIFFIHMGFLVGMDQDDADDRDMNQMTGNSEEIQSAITLILQEKFILEQLGPVDQKLFKALEQAKHYLDRKDLFWANVKLNEAAQYISSGADINFRINFCNNEVKKPLLIIYHYHSMITDFLLANGACPHITDTQGGSLLHIIMEKKDSYWHVQK
jgi:hypothetical protein